jgi:hypothetical protein
LDYNLSEFELLIGQLIGEGVFEQEQTGSETSEAVDTTLP